MDDSTAIIGSGAIGGYLAGELQRAGRDVTLCVRTPIDRLVIVDEGIEREAPVRIATDPGAAGPVRWILLATKAQDVPGAAPWLAALAGPETTTVVVQNGIDHEERARPFLPAGAAVLPAIIHCSVERPAPGRVVHHGGARLAVPRGAEGAAFAALFAGTVFAVAQEEDFTTTAWRKLLSNAIVNPLTALTLRRMSLFEDERIRALARELFAEVVAVGRAAGARIDMADAEEVLAGYRRSGEGGSSMLYDRLAERPLEHAFISGAVVRAGDAHGVPVPLNRALLALAGAASGHRLDASA